MYIHDADLRFPRLIGSCLIADDPDNHDVYVCRMARELWDGRRDGEN